MGEIAEQIVEGFLCERCTQMVDGTSTGYPRACDDCKRDKQTHRNRKTRKRKKRNN